MASVWKWTGRVSLLISTPAIWENREVFSSIFSPFIWCIQLNHRKGLIEWLLSCFLEPPFSKWVTILTETAPCPAVLISRGYHRLSIANMFSSASEVSWRERKSLPVLYGRCRWPPTTLHALLRSLALASELSSPADWKRQHGRGRANSKKSRRADDNSKWRPRTLFTPN